MSTPAELWLQHQTDVAELDDEPIFAAVTIDLDEPATLTVTRIAVTSDRPQGLILDADGPLTVGELEAPSMVLWSDTAPAELAVEAPAGRLTISHAWRDGDIVHAWTGWTGITRSDDPDDPSRLNITASDGHDGISRDLEIEIRLDRPG